MVRFLLFLFLAGILLSCGGSKEEKKEERVVLVPPFNGDSAYAFIKKQVSFGPRIPNTPQHRKTGDFLISTLRHFGATVTVQEFEANTFDGQRLVLRNIIASYFPEKQKRILLAAHWDTRPFADKDSNEPDAKFDGANDGASGVGVLLEIARVLGKNPPPGTGIDIILFDGEDWGEKESASNRITPPRGLDSWWCLGSQHWSNNKHRPGYTAYYGILLDMVGAKGAHFFKEGYSLDYAPKIVNKVWNTASRLGHSSVFVRQQEGAVTDDHKYVNEVAKIPMIDIVPFDPGAGNFGDYHHTRNDNLSLISRETLNVVGTVLLNVIYYEE